MTDIAVTSSVRENRKRGGAIASTISGAAIPALVIAAWIAIQQSGLVTSHLLVPIQTVLTLPFIDVDGREMWSALGLSILRLIAGFAIGVSLGISLGLLMGLSRFAATAISPSFNALRQITLFAWIPLLTAWFGNGETPKLVYIAMSAFFPAALNTYIGLRNIPARYIDVAEVLRLSRRTRLTKLVLPAALPSIWVGIQVALITAWLGTVSSEYAMGMGRGLGGFIAEGRGQFRMDVVLLGVIVLALVGYVVNVACDRIFRYLFRARM